jgi:hypothetical protein
MKDAPSLDCNVSFQINHRREKKKKKGCEWRRLVTGLVPTHVDHRPLQQSVWAHVLRLRVPTPPAQITRAHPHVFKNSSSLIMSTWHLRERVAVLMHYTS